MNINQIKQCQANEGPTLLNQEIKLTDKYKISGSPTLLISETIFQGDRTPEAYKEEICSGFKVAPKECNKKLSDTTSNASTSGCK